MKVVGIIISAILICVFVGLIVYNVVEIVRSLKKRKEDKKQAERKE